MIAYPGGLELNCDVLTEIYKGDVEKQFTRDGNIEITVAICGYGNPEALFNADRLIVRPAS
jgi:hypothetical protein